MVITLDKKSFVDHCATLAAMVASDLPPGGYDAVVGVYSGGSAVCTEFCHFFPLYGYAFRTDVVLQRPSTKKKKRFPGKMLRFLPVALLDIMRIIEARCLMLARRSSGPRPAADVELSDGLKRALRVTDAPKILIIDDAIDSGDTLFAVIEALKLMNPDVAVKVAVISVTTKAPRVNADFSIYRNRTLIRFPWSLDYKMGAKTPGGIEPIS